jgi:16S rRNA (adenine1518-N6/adenine1519-N6)-dimethyltransferase
MSRAPSEPNLIGVRRTAQLLERHGIVPQKRLGQNFIIDPNTIRMIVDRARIDSGDRVLEIGAGAGALTVALAGEARHVTAVEIDDRLAPVLHEVVGGLENVDVLIGDALAVDLSSSNATRMMGNLPYSVATDVILRVLQEVPRVRDLTVMVQKEVGERLTARPGDKGYGKTCLHVRYFAQSGVVGRASRRAFLPVPHVDSVVVRLERRSEPPDVAGDHFLTIIQAAFSQRRKTMRNALISAKFDGRDVEAALASAGIEAATRPQDVGFEQFIEVAGRLT